MAYTKLIAILILALVLCPIVLAVGEDSMAIRDLQNAIERSRLQLTKAISDTSVQTSAQVNSSIEANFAVMDARIQQFNKNTIQNTAIVVVVGFLLAFVLSQIIRISLERKRRKILIKQRFELETYVNQLEQDATRLSKAIAQYQRLEKEYSAKLGALTGKKKHNWALLFSIISFCLGALAIFALHLFKVL